MPDVVVLGAGGMGAEVAETILTAKGAGADWDFLGFLDDAPSRIGQHVIGLPVLGSADWIAEHRDTQVALGIGHPWTRYTAVQRLDTLGVTWATVIGPDCTISPSATVNEGTVVFAGSSLSSRSSLGRLCYLNYHASISHDASVGDFACVMAQTAVSGDVKVGEGAFLGVGVSTRQGVSIGAWSLIGAGASVVRDIPPYCVAVGVPAKPIRFYDGPNQMPPF